MKSFEEIKKEKKDGDYELEGKSLGLSKDTIRAIVNGRRSDNSHVQLAFSILFELRNNFPKLVKSHIDRGLLDVDIPQCEPVCNE